MPVFDDVTGAHVLEKSLCSLVCVGILNCGHKLGKNNVSSIDGRALMYEPG